VPVRSNSSQLDGAMPRRHFVVVAMHWRPDWGRSASANPPNFIFLQTAVQKFVTMHGSVHPGVYSNNPAPTYPTANYEPRTCPYSKVIFQPTLHSLNRTELHLTCIIMHIHEAPISLLRRIARISVVTEASCMKLSRNGETVHFRFSKDCFIAETFS
jgi:hypothetical protein